MDVIKLLGLHRFATARASPEVVEADGYVHRAIRIFIDGIEHTDTRKVLPGTVTRVSNVLCPIDGGKVASGRAQLFVNGRPASLSTMLFNNDVIYVRNVGSSDAIVPPMPFASSG